MSAPAKAMFCGASDTGITPSVWPCGLNTSTPAAMAAYTRPSASMARPSAPLLNPPAGVVVTFEYFAKLRRAPTEPSGFTSKASRYSPLVLLT